MKGYSSRSWLILVSLWCLVNSTTGKRFDINNGFGDIEDFDVPQLIEIDNAELAEMSMSSKGKGKPGKPKPEKPKPDFMLPLLPNLPDSFGLSSSWNLGSALGTSGFLPSLTASRPTSSNNPGAAAAVWNAGGESNFQVSPTQAEISLSQSFGSTPPRPSSPTLGSPSNSLAVEYLSPQVIPPPVWSSNSQRPPHQQNVQQQQVTVSSSQYPPVVPAVSSPSIWTVEHTQSQQPLILYEEPSSVSQQTPPSYWSSQTPSASAHAPVSWQQPTPQESISVQVSPPSSWSQPVVTHYQSSYQTYQPPSSPPNSPAQTQTLSHYQQPSSAVPYSHYQQLNLHLLDPQTWEKLQGEKPHWQPQDEKPYWQPQDDKLQWQPQYEIPLAFPSQQLSSHQPQYQLQGASILILPPEVPAFNATAGTPAGSNNTSVNFTVINNNNSGGNSISSDGYIAQLLDAIDGMVDYINPGHSPLPQYTNSDISVDEDKYFDKDDDFMTLESDEDEMMKMVE